MLDMAKKDIYLEDELLKEWMHALQSDFLKKGVKITYKQILYKYIFGVPYDKLLPEKIETLPRPVLTRLLLQKNR